MSAQEELAYAVKRAFDSYVAARSDLSGALGAIGRDEFDEILSSVEEFGAHHARMRIQKDPLQFGIEPTSVSSASWADDLEQKLQRYVDANYTLDGVVAEQEQRRIEEGWPAEIQTIAFHGEFPVVDLVNLTVTFPGRAPEALVLREGSGPEPLQPQPAPSRRRARGRGR